MNVACSIKFYFAVNVYVSPDFAFVMVYLPSVNVTSALFNVSALSFSYPIVISPLDIGTILISVASPSNHFMLTSAPFFALMPLISPLSHRFVNHSLLIRERAARSGSWSALGLSYIYK